MCVWRHLRQGTFFVISRSMLGSNKVVRSVTSHSAEKTIWRPTPSITLGKNRTIYQNNYLVTYVRRHSRGGAPFSVTSSEEKIYNWNQCEYKTAYSSSLKMHERKHTGEKLHHCIQCESKVAKSRNLQTHKTTHSSEKPERCTICEYSCIRKVDMKVHMMQGHTGKRPFKCVQCNFASAQSSYLKTHMRTHMMERPFKCNQCEKTYKSKQELTRHARTHQTLD